MSNDIIIPAGFLQYVNTMPGQRLLQTFQATAPVLTSATISARATDFAKPIDVVVYSVGSGGAPDPGDVVYRSSPVNVEPNPIFAFDSVTVPLDANLVPGAEYVLAVENLSGSGSISIETNDGNPYPEGLLWVGNSPDARTDLAVDMRLQDLPVGMGTVARAGASSALDMAQLDLSNLRFGTITHADANLIVISFDPAFGSDRDELRGENFQFNAAGELVGGTLEGIREYRSYKVAYELSHLSVPGAQAFSWLQPGATQQALATIFGGADSMIGSDLNDKLYGYDGPDTIVGGAGEDTLFGNRGQDSIDGGAGNDAILGGQGADRLAGGEGDDTLNGDLGDDTLSGGGGQNVLFGGDGADSIVGGSGFDRVNGNQGADTIVGHSIVGDWLSGGQGNDLLDATASTGNNILNGNLGDDTIFGGSGADTLRGGQGDDVIHAGSGSDWLFGDLGENTIFGGQGPDTFRAGAGHDLVNGWHTGDRVLVAAGVTWTVSQVNGDVRISLSDGGEMDLLNTQISSLQPGWIVSE